MLTDEFRAKMNAKIEAVFADKRRRKEMQIDLIPAEDRAFLEAHRDVLCIGAFATGPLAGYGTTPEADRDVSQRVTEIIWESVAAMLQAGEIPEMMPMDFARVAAGLPVED